MTICFDSYSATCARLRASLAGAMSVAAIAFLAATPPASGAATKEALRALDPAERGLIARLNDEREVTRGPGGAPLARLQVSSA